MCSCSGLVCGNELPIFFFGSRDHHDLHSFPTRRSSDLKAVDDRLIGGPHVVPTEGLGSASTVLAEPRPSVGTTWGPPINRSSTAFRSEERRVGKECRSWWSRDPKKKIGSSFPHTSPEQEHI